MSRKQSSAAKLMISIVSNSDAKLLTSAMSDAAMCLHYCFLGRGTAKSGVRDFLGLTETEKTIVASIIPASMEEQMLTIAVETVKLYLVGKGIAFTMPLTSLSSLINKKIVTDKNMPVKKGGKSMNNGIYDLVVAVYNHELTDKVLDAAKAAGAVGGTLVNSRTISSESIAQAGGFRLSEDTEILLILTKREERNAIMRAVQSVAGLKTEGGGVVLSLPVDALVGIGSVGDEFRKSE